MIKQLLQLNETQTRLFYTAIITIIAQLTCIYYLTETKEKFKIKYCFGYLVFACISLLFYYKIILP
jgi:hypothetical protein